MASYFLTFNPEKGNFSDYARAVEETQRGRPYVDNWKVSSKKINQGDRVFVLRQGKEETGLPHKRLLKNCCFVADALF